MRILAFSDFLDLSGSALALLRVLAGLARHHHVDLLSRQTTPAAVAPYLSPNLVLIPPEQRAARYDVVLCNSIITGAAVPDLSRLGPVVWWIHEPATGLAFLERTPDLAAGFDAARLVLFPTRWQAETLYAPWLTHARWRVVDNASPFQPAGRAPLIKKDPGAFLLLQIGFVTPRKGADLTLAALRRLQDPDLLCLCVGAQDPSFALDVQPSERRRFQITGMQSEERVAALLEHADALVCPTRDDLVSLAILEGLAAGLPVIASDFGPIPEALSDGVDALLFPVDDVAAYADRIRRVKSDPALRASLSAGARATSARRFSFARHVAGIEAALREAAA